MSRSKIKLIVSVCLILLITRLVFHRSRIPNPSELKPRFANPAVSKTPNPEPIIAIDAGGNSGPEVYMVPKASPSPLNITPAYTDIRHPETGIYYYDTDGYEEYGRIIMARYIYPSETARTISASSYGKSVVNMRVEQEYAPGSFWYMNLDYSNNETDITEFHLETQNGELNVLPLPPLIAEKLPYTVGSNWNGGWNDDDISGTFLRTVTDSGYIAVGTKEVFAYKVETQFKYDGQYEGSGYIEDWINPENGLILYTYFRHVGHFGFFDYDSEVTLKLKSLNPA